MDELSHIDNKGEAHMVNIIAKDNTFRQAVASGRVKMAPATLKKIKEASLAKGDALALARIAGIMAAKKTAYLIPLCHNILISSVGLEFGFVSKDTIEIKAEVGSLSQTGVEMEALVAVTAAALTIYDTAKSIDRGMTIEAVRLEVKTGGKGGTYRRGES
jgi:cyclic pyranopterin phosphate synthase